MTADVPEDATTTTLDALLYVSKPERGMGHSHVSAFRATAVSLFC